MTTRKKTNPQKGSMEPHLRALSQGEWGVYAGITLREKARAVSVAMLFGHDMDGASLPVLAERIGLSAEEVEACLDVLEAEIATLRATSGKVAAVPVPPR